MYGVSIGGIGKLMTPRIKFAVQSIEFVWENLKI